MNARFLFAVMMAAAATLPATAQPDPAVTVQVQPLGRLLDDAKSIARAVAGDDVALKMNESIEAALGEKGFDGIDLLRPIVGYVTLAGPVNGPEDLSGVAIVPITGEKEFIAFLGRIKLEADPIKGKTGLYAIDPAGGDGGPVKVRMRVVDRNAYVGVNVADDAMAADKLAKPADLIDPAERGLVAMRSRFDKLPKEYAKQQAEQFEQMRALLQNSPAPEKIKDGLGKLLDYMIEANERTYAEGESSVARLLYDRAAAEIVYEVGFKAKAGTQLAKMLADTTPTTNQFAGLMTKDTAAAVLVQAPLFAPKLNDILANLIEVTAEEVNKNDPPPEPARPAIDAALAGLARTVKSGDLDAAAVLTGPNAGGAFTAIAALTFDDPSKLEQELKALHKMAPDGVRDLIKLDVAKVGGVSVHEAAVGAFLPAEAQTVFGGNAVVVAAFAPKAVYLAFGPDARAAVAAAIAAKPGPAKAFDVVVNPARVHKLVAAINPNVGDLFGKAVGSDDKKVSVLYVEVAGGAEVTVRMGASLLLPKAGMMSFLGRAAAIVPAP